LGGSKSLTGSENPAGMFKFVMNAKKALVVSVYGVQRIAKAIGKNSQLASDLQEFGIHEVRILA